MDYIDTTTLTLEEFMNVLFSKKKDEFYPNAHFPTEELRNEYLLEIKHRSDIEIKRLLKHFLPVTGTYGHDELMTEVYGLPEKIKSLDDEFRETEYFHRLFLHSMKGQIPVWDGLFWLLDLLPHFPQEAINALNSYFMANCQFLPDDRLVSISDCIEIIHAKYLDVIPELEQINYLSPLDFEVLVLHLFKKMGFLVNTTKRSFDGGIDVVAERNGVSEKMKLYIQCKRYSKNVGIRPVRELYGVIMEAGVNKGVLITTSDFTKEARKFTNSNLKIELINGENLLKLTKETIGPLWATKLQKLILNFKVE